ncbi:GlsB/YeaQ/YmgE family stress response membrane protein [Ktedonospora formicarum]|uniref:Transglycosylase n=1 Tax=Ktedonospora formicarum TaxID=2778364 RepID=A0A8J3IC29_9CHLR|nr:transglycosylase [Ktedonospora formicarum]GHO49548.1 hypothetical protein KSX_77110 [Ktedonospora formicarum]
MVLGALVISLTKLIVWLLIALLVGVLGELIAHRRTPDGFLGAVVLGFLAIFLVVGVLDFHIVGEPYINGVPLISSILAAVLLVVIWSGFVYHRARPYYYRRSTYAHRPRTTRRRWF